MRRDLLVYLSGPMTAAFGHTIEDNVASGVRVFLTCIAAGIPAISPQLSGAFPSAWTAVSWETWIAYDCAVIDRCSHVLMLPRWETSKGARFERDYALSRGTPVVYAIEELPTADRPVP